MKVVIVEDEPYAQQELIRLLERSGREIELLARIDSVEESIEWFSGNSHPDLVFLDIQLADGLSFDIFREIELRSAVIFTTAYDEYAIRAFELNSIDYLLKPVKYESLDTALQKYEKMKAHLTGKEDQFNEKNLRKVMEMMSGKGYKNRFLTRIGDQIKSISIEDTAYFKADDNIVFLVSKDGHKHIVEHTLEQLEGMLDPARFFRLNRTFITDVSAIKKVSKYFNSRLVIELDPKAEEQVLVSRVKAKEFMVWLDQ
jgi:DNA-binding LytR/AlgR family response regulator